MAYIEQEYCINLSDININAKATNKSIIKYFESIASFHSDLAKYGVREIEKTRLTWIVLNWKVKIFSRPSYGDKIKVITWARETGRASTHRDFKIFDENGNIIAIASSKWSMINIDSGLARIDSTILDSYSPETECVFGQEKLNKLAEPDKYEASTTLKVTRRDIDINKHVHNLNYLDYAYELIPEELFINEPNEFEIYYRAEAVLGDELEIRYSKVLDEHIIAIKKKSDDSLLTVIKLK